MKQTIKFACFAIALIFLFHLGVQHLPAQLLLGSIAGTVTDSTGAAIPGATVVTKSVDTNLERTAVTRDDGYYQIPDLPIGSPNSVFYKAIGVSNYHALEFQLRKQLTAGLLINAAYTWSHSLDEQSGLGLFYNGNDPLNPRSGYASSDFDRTHVLSVHYLYQLPKLARGNRLLGALIDSWEVSGLTVLQSGQPYNVYDFTGAIASVYYSSNDFITNPIVPLAPGKTNKDAQLQGTTGVNAGKPVLDSAAFGIPHLQPGQLGVPPCDVNPDGTQLCDTFETGFGATGRNTFRAPFQWRFDTALGKEFRVNERVRLKYRADFFNLFNHPSFDAPNNNVEFYNFNNPPDTNNPPRGSLGFIQHTLGSPRFIQMSLHVIF